MNTLFTYASSFDPQTLKMGFNIVFIAIIVLIMVGGLIGMIRGVFNSGYRLIFMGLLVLMCYLFTADIAKAIAKIDIGSLFNIGNMTISNSTFPVTSVEETIAAALQALASDNDGLSIIADPASAALAQELAMMILRFITFIILGILVATLGSFLCTVTYHLIVKLFIPKKLRKKVRMRLLSFIFGITKSILVTSLLLFPFTSLLNTINQSAKKGESGETINNELYNQIMDWINAYDDSLLAQALFNWTADENGKTFDVSLINLATGDGKDSLVFLEELASLTDGASALLGSGGITDDGIDISLILTDVVVSAVIESLLNSNIITAVLPLVATFALNIEGIEDYIDTSKINVDEIDWTNEFHVVEGIVNDINALGIIDFNDIAEGNNTVLIRNLFNTEKKSSVISLFRSLDNSGIMSQVVPAMLYTLANKEITLVDNNSNEELTFESILPKDWDSYRNIKIGNEFAILYSSLFDINVATDDALLDEIAPIENNNIQPFEQIRFNAITKNLDIKNENQEDKTDITSIIIENASKVLPALVGKVNQDGEPIVDDKGLSLPEDGICLLDSELIYLSMNTIVNTLLKALADSIEGYDLPQEDINELLEEFTNRTSYKREFNVLLDIVAEIMNNPNLEGIQEESLDIGNQETVDALKVVLPKVDNSKIMTRILPDILETSLEEDIDYELQDYDLTINDFDFRVPKFGSEMANLLDAYQSIERLNDAFSGENTEESLKNINSADVKIILDTIYISKILNPNKISVNRNFYKIIDGIFNYEGLEVNGITSRVSEIEEVKWLDYQENGQDCIGENTRIADFFANLNNDDIISMFNENGAEIHDSNKFDLVALRSLFNSVGESKVVSEGFGSILDRVLLKSINTENLDISFENVYEWKTEGENLATALEGLQKINKSLNNINWINENPVYLNDILSSFSQSQLFINKLTEESNFDDYMFENMKTAIPNYLKDYGSGDTDETRTYNEAKTDFNSVVMWKDEIDSITDIIGTIQTFAPLQSTAKGDDGLKALQDGSLSASDMELTLITINESTSFRTVLVNVLDLSLNDNSMALGTMKLSDSNIATITLMDKQERAIEIDYLVEVYYQIDLMNLKDGFELRNIEGEEIKKLLDAVYKSKIFNTFKEEQQVLTVFEQMIKMIVEESDFETKILEPNQTLEEKIQSISNDYAGTELGKTDEWTIEDGETTKIGELVSAYKNTGVSNFEITSEELENLMSTDEDIDKFGNLLSKINNSRLFYKGLPAMLDESLEKDLIEVKGLNVNTKLVNSDYNNGAPYHEDEVVKLTDVMKSFRKLNDVKDEHGQKIDNPTLIDYDLDILEETLNKLHNSRVLNTVKGVTRQQTFFENVAASIIIKADIDKRITSPTRSFDSIIFGIGNDIVDNQETDGWVGAYKEISRIVDLLDEFKVLGIDDGEKITAKNNWTETEVYNTLSALNNSRICYRSVPSYMDELIDNRQVNGVNLTAANTYYNGDLKYDDGEIDTISKIYVSLDSSSTLIEKMQDITSLSDTEINDIKTMLNNLAISQVFHISGSDIVDANTVFEQTIEKFLVDSTLSELAHDATIFADDGTHNATEKARANIIKHSAIVENNSPLYTWAMEINHLFSVVEVVRDNTAITTIDAIDSSKLSPATVSLLFKALGNSHLVYDAVPAQIKEIFTNIGFASFAENHEDYLLAASTKDYRQEYLDHEIDTLIPLLSAAYDDSAERYIDFGDQGFNIIDVLGAKFKMEVLITYFSDSWIFYDCRGLTLKNTIHSAGYSGFIRTEYDINHKNVFDRIFDLIEEDNNQIIFEGFALDSMLIALTNFVGNTFKSLNATGISGLYRTTFDDNHIGMFASEILFGFLDQKLNESSLVKDGFTHEWFKNAGGQDFIYPMANENEARGIEGAIKLINLADISFGNPANISNEVMNNIADAFALLENNGEKSIIACSIYYKGFYIPFRGSVESLYDNADTFFLNEISKNKFKNNYDAMIGDAFLPTFAFSDESDKVKGILEAIVSVTV